MAEADGTLHLIWQDRFDGFFYTSGTTSSWAEAVAVTFPFSSPFFTTPANDNFNTLFTPELVLDKAGIVHAFWQVEESLFYSNAPLAEMTSSTAWSDPQTLAASAPIYAITLAADGRLHLAYVRTASTEELPAGVYYRQRTNENWSNANRIYQSNYLRAASAENLHIDIAAVGAERIFVAWDNYLVDTVFYIQSTTGGSGWSDTVALDRRGENDSFDAPGPHYLQVITQNQQVHFLWNRYPNAARCELVHRWSDDGGQTWQTPKTIFEGVNCPARRHALLEEATDSLHLFTEQEQGSNVVRTWLGFDWGTPQTISGLTDFANPETFRTVSMTCFNPTITQGRLTVIGCGQDNVADIWAIATDLPELSQTDDSLFERWQQPELIVRASATQTTPKLLYGQDGIIHAFWLEQQQPLLADSEASVRYAYWDGDNWSRPAPVVEGRIDRIAVDITADNRLLLTWRSLRTASIQFSQVDAAQAAFPAQWSPPRDLIIDSTAISHPFLLAAGNNELYLAYAITLNEGRGIYVMRSSDGGLNWSEPIAAFDGAQAGWSMVGPPTMASTTDGGLHLMWGRYSLLHDDQSEPTAYYYARSSNQGEDWSATPTLVVEGTVTKGRLVAVPSDNSLLRLWQTANDEMRFLWYQWSDDGGRTWDQATLLPSREDLAGDVATFVDPAGRLHVVHAGANQSDNIRLDSWFWESDGWETVDSTVFDLAMPVDGDGLSAIVQDDGTFLTVFGALMMSQNSTDIESRLFYTKRSIVLPEERPSAPVIMEEPTPLAIPVADEELAEEQLPAPTPTIDIAALAEESTIRTQFGPIDTNTFLGRVLAGVLPAILIVAIGIALGLYALRARDSQ